MLAPGVWAAIQNDKGGHAISNAGIIDLGEKTLVFDAFINPDAAAELKLVAEDLTKHRVSFVINSHFHDDHIRGNQAFVPGASIISTEWTRKEMERVEPEEREWARKNIAAQIEKAKKSVQRATGEEREEEVMWLGYYEAISQSLPNLKMVLPEITFKDSMWIRGSVRSVEIIECHGGHTASDAILILPQEGIAFMGDVLFVNRHPWFGDGQPDSLKSLLHRFYKDSSLKQFVPGHGPVAGREALQTLMNYISDLQEMASAAASRREPDSLFAKTPVPASYRNWWFGRFYPDNLSTLYDNAKDKK